MLKPHFDELAHYNRWTNWRLYDDAASLPDHVRKRPIGLFFGSVHGTFNHLLMADQIWMRRITGEGPQPARLNQVLHEDFADLRTARGQEDDRIADFVTGLDEAGYDRVLEYRNSSGKTFQQRLGSASSTTRPIIAARRMQD
nr:DinB family protein [uncultured Rhodopila sp.]